MAQKTIQTRVRMKNDTEQNWSKAINFIPLDGEIIIYDADSNHPRPRIKIGDGVTSVNNLPFLSTDITGVKGAAEAEYRTGNINITKDDIGLNNVDNTTDAAKPISVAAQAALDNKVDKIEGKQLSTNDYTTAEKNKLAGIQPEATATSVTSSSNGGQEVGRITVNGEETIFYAPAAPTSISVIQASTSPSIVFVVGTHSSSVAALTGALTTNELVDGMVIYYFNPYALPNNNVTLTLTFANNTVSSAIPLYSSANDRKMPKLPAGSVIPLIYYNNGFYLAASVFAYAK